MQIFEILIKVMLASTVSTHLFSLAAVTLQVAEKIGGLEFSLSLQSVPRVGGATELTFLKYGRQGIPPRRTEFGKSHGNRVEFGPEILLLLPRRENLNVNRKRLKSSHTESKELLHIQHVWGRLAIIGLRELDM
jgi:hypothetical protein